MTDIHDIVNRVVQESEHKEKQVIEDYVNSVVLMAQMRIRSLVHDEAYKIPDQVIKSKILSWSLDAKNDIAFKAKEALRIILRQELLGEK